MTVKQEITSKKILENPGMPVSKAMREAGYSEAFSKNPQEFTHSKAWQELMEEFLSDEYLAEKHQELLEKKETIAIGKKGEREAIITDQIDGNAVAKGLDMAYKLKGRYAAEKIKIEDAYEGLSDEEIEQKIAELQAKKKGEGNDTA